MGEKGANLEHHGTVGRRHRRRWCVIEFDPGGGALGFGIDVTAASDWTDRTSLLVGLDIAHGTNVLEPQNGPNQTEYLLPLNVSVADIWQTSTSYDMYSSRAEYATAMSATAAIKGSAWGFSAEFNASYGKIAEGQSTAFYGQSSTKTSLWNVSINDLSDLSLDGRSRRRWVTCPVLSARRTSTSSTRSSPSGERTSSRRRPSAAAWITPLR